MSKPFDYKKIAGTCFGVAIFFIAFLVPAIEGIGQEKKSSQFETYADRVMTVHDKNKDGFLSVWESQSIKNRNLVDRSRFDLDKDNRISRLELIRALSDTVSEPELDQKTQKLVREYLLIAGVVLESYDENGNGSLEDSELEMMRRPIPKHSQYFKDGSLSRMELAISLSNFAFDISSVRKYQKWQADNERAAKRDSAQQVKVFFGFLNTALSNHDLNRNNQLDPEEIADALWSTPWEPSDLNGDGILSYAELADRYRKMLDVSPEMIANSISANQENDKPSLVQIKKAPRDGIEGFAGFKGTKADDSKNSKKQKPTSAVTPQPLGNLTVEIYLLNPSEKVQLAEIQKNVALIENVSDVPIKNRVANAAKSLQCTNFDALQGPTLIGSKTVLSTQSNVLVKLSEVGQTSGQGSRMGQWDEGLKAIIFPKKEDGGIELDLELKKSDGKLNEDQTEFAGTSNWNFSSTLKVQKGKPSVVLTSFKNRNLVLVVNVTERR